MAMSSDTQGRGQWGSSLGFIMAAAGSAVGLGNIWRFPYLTGENGGGAFVLYAICVLLIGLPLLLNEIALEEYPERTQSVPLKRPEKQVLANCRDLMYPCLFLCVELLFSYCRLDDRIYFYGIDQYSGRL